MVFWLESPYSVVQLSLSGISELKQRFPNQSRARSTLNSDVDPQQLINQYAGTGQHVNPNKARLGEPGSVERVRTDSPIGNYVDANGVNHGSTNNFTIKYANDGVHIVPAAP